MATEITLGNVSQAGLLFAWMAGQHFRDLFCERFGVPQSRYEKRALQALLYPHARLAAPLLRLLIPGFLRYDLKFIRDLGGAEDFQEAEATVSEFRGATRLGGGFWRSQCRLRVSGRKAGKLVRDLFTAAANRAADDEARPMQTQSLPSSLSS